MIQARTQVVSDTLELHQLMLGPRRLLLSNLLIDLFARLAISRYRLARRVLIDGKATFAEIALGSGLSEYNVRRSTKGDGPTGESAIALAQEVPGLRMIVQDTYMRCSWTWNKRQLTYLFRLCFRTWSDPYAMVMLRALVPALQPGALVLTNGIVLPPPEPIPLGMEREFRNDDLTMTMVFNSGDRELAD
ncbi:hypothetical protein GGR52DRAFT_575434 [Hypoxylon sp. FL1284]|nr:hypothetical protein GGR52DRAFT_575434 [Hypoxylon sp. FL1284]